MWVFSPGSWAICLYGKKKQFLALNSSSSTSQSLIFKELGVLLVWLDIVMPVTHTESSDEKHWKARILLHFLSFITVSTLPPPHQSNSCYFSPTAHLSLPLGALWGRDHSPLCSTGLFLLLDFAFAQQNPEVFNKPM